MKLQSLVILTFLVSSSPTWAIETMLASKLTEHLNRMPHSTVEADRLTPQQLMERIFWSKEDPEVLGLPEGEQKIVQETVGYWGFPIKSAAYRTAHSRDDIEGASIRETKNEKGNEVCSISPFHRLALDSIGPGSRVLDLGSAYGFMTRRALAKGAIVTAVDMSGLHIAALVGATPMDQRNRLWVSVSTFPSDFTSPPDASFDVVIVGLLIHYLPSEHVQTLFQSVHRWLAPAGSFFVMAVTPGFMDTRDLIRIARQRVTAAKEKIHAHAIAPGEMVFPTDFSKFPPRLLSSLRLDCDPFHPQDVDLTRFNLERAGFQVGTTRRDYGTFSLSSEDAWLSFKFDGIAECPFALSFDISNEDHYFYVRAVKTNPPR